MHTLTRTVRFALNPPGQRGGDANAYAGRPSMLGLRAHMEVDVACEGEADPVTGYVIDIKTIDRAVRESVVPILERTIGAPNASSIPDLLRDLIDALSPRLPVTLRALTLRPSPYYRVAMDTNDRRHVLMTQRFDISAAHRLHAPSLSDEQNATLYGKCNNPRGHGHNYVVEPCVEIEAGIGDRFTLQDLERLTDRHIVQPFDHKHLNEDTPEFDARRGGVLPSVENISRVFYERLRPALESEHPGVRLRTMTVWETDRTRATYPSTSGRIDRS